MTKRRLIVIFSVLAIACVGAFVWKRNAPDWVFVSRVTGFQFPSGTQFLAQYDNAEWFVVSVVRLPEDVVSSFTSQNRFIIGGRHSMDAAFAFPPKYRSLPDRPDVLSAVGQTKYQSWDAMLDPQTRLLWIQITYPDPSGDHSGTAPQPIPRKEPNQTLEPTAPSGRGSS